MTRMPYRVVLLRRSYRARLVISRHETEDAARDTAEKAVMALPAGLIAEVWCGTGRSASRLYAVEAK